MNLVGSCYTDISRYTEQQNLKNRADVGVIFLIEKEIWNKIFTLSLGSRPKV